MKRFISIILTTLMLFSAFSTAVAVNAETTEVVDYSPGFAGEGGLYVQGVNDSKQAWQKWMNYSGLYAESNVKYMFLSAQAPDDAVNIYNAYSEDMVVNGVEIKSGQYALVPYVDGQKATAKRGNTTYTYIILKSSASASVYVNDVRGNYETDDGRVFDDFYEFLIDDKNNSVKGSDVAVITEDGLLETQLKKFKGRGNTNWKSSDKKQFNLTFNDTVEIEGVSDKKFSLINNERDGSAIRNKMIFDVANEVGLPFSTDTRYIDLYINGDFRGCFLASKKVEMGKKALIALEDTSEDEGVVDNFNFAVEIDIWNYANDTHFTSDYGQEIVLNTPELEDYDSSDPVQKAQMDFIQKKYAEFENALYKGNMAELEKICDVESLAKAYLIQEWTKNCDGGLTSTYYTYYASEGKFKAVPVWDFDSGLGNVDAVRAGASVSTVYPHSWLTKTVSNKGNSNSRYVNTLGQPFNLNGTTSQGKTYLDYVKETWKNDFIPAIKVAVGQAETTSDRLKSMDQYIAAYEKAFYNNYVVWGFAWGPQKGMGTSYPNTYQGHVDYLRDWTIARTNWMTTELLGADGELLKEKEQPAKTIEEGAKLYLTGTGFGGWESTDYELTVNEDRTKATIDITLVKGETYRFKLKKIVGRETSYYVADYNHSTTGKYFFADPSSSNYNVKSQHTETVNLTLTFDATKETFTVVERSGEVNPTEPPTQEPTEKPTQAPTQAPTETPTVVDTPIERDAQLYLVGEGFFEDDENYEGWNSRELPLTISEDRNSAYIDISMKAGTTYIFKVVKIIDEVDVEYYTADFEDTETSKYVLMDTSNEYSNALAAPFENLELTLTFNAATKNFTLAKRENKPTEPTVAPTDEPTEEPTQEPTDAPTDEPTVAPTSPADTKFALVGYINGKNVGIEDNYMNDGYVFENSKVTVELEKTSYVHIKKVDNSAFYMFNDFCMETSGTLVNTENGAIEQMYVPAGTVTFTLVENEDGTLTLSYVVDEDPTDAPTEEPSETPSEEPTQEPTEEPTEEPSIPVENKVAYMVNTNNWADVNAYVWGGEAGEIAVWPGTPATLVDEAKGIYSFDVTNNDFLIWNNGNGAQTGDYTVADVAGKYYEPKTNELYDTAEAAIEAANAVTDPTQQPTETPTEEPTTAPTEPAKKTPVLNAESKNMKAGATFKVTVKDNVDNEKVTFSVSKKDKNTIKVSKKGKVTALQKGTATVNVKVGKLTLKCKVTVTTDPTLTNAKGKVIKTLKLKKGKTAKVYITGRAKALKNAYVDNKVANISGGKKADVIKVTAKKKGNTTITVKVNRVKNLQLKVKVK